MGRWVVGNFLAESSWCCWWVEYKAKCKNGVSVHDWSNGSSQYEVWNLCSHLHEILGVGSSGVSLYTASHTYGNRTGYPHGLSSCVFSFLQRMEPLTHITRTVMVFHLYVF